MKTTQVAVDLAKSVFEIAVSHEVGHVSEHRRLNRSGFRRFLERQEPSEILMEACGTAHYWGRECQAMGHRVRLLPAGDVRRYRDGNKTGRTDTKALLEPLTHHMLQARHLMSVPGIGMLSATALVAFVGDIRRFPSCRSFADYLGLTPREHSSGAVRRLGRITKRGNRLPTRDFPSWPGQPSAHTRAGDTTAVDPLLSSPALRMPGESADDHGRRGRA